jgi:hypothetical protein
LADDFSGNFADLAGKNWDWAFTATMAECKTDLAGKNLDWAVRPTMAEDKTIVAIDAKMVDSSADAALG